MKAGVNSLGLEAQSELQAFANSIKVARKRRKISRASMAERIGVSTSTIVRLEAGDPTVAIGTTFQALNVLGLVRGISKIAAPEHDIAQVLNEVRDLRMKTKSSHKKVFSEEELDF